MDYPSLVSCVFTYYHKDQMEPPGFQNLISWGRVLDYPGRDHRRRSTEGRRLFRKQIRELRLLLP